MHACLLFFVSEDFESPHLGFLVQLFSPKSVYKSLPPVNCCISDALFLTSMI
uniref:Uncharacterized protein n=1 Tax=Arundo donax TaxID=35708 RepID=A0A0A9TN72_ARUDO